TTSWARGPTPCSDYAGCRELLDQAPVFEPRLAALVPSWTACRVSGGWAGSATPENMYPAIITTQARLVISGVIVDDPGREAGTAGFSMNLARSVQIAEREIAVPVVRTRDKRVTD